MTTANRRRIEIACACDDCARIPKVADAGRVVDGAQVMHNGVRVVASGYHGDWMTELIARLGGHHEPQEERAFHEVVERLRATEQRPVMLELGAFWSYYSLWCRHAIPGTRNYLLDPSAENLELARANFALNGYSGVFFQRSIGRLGGRRYPTVETVSVDELADRESIERIDLLHADIQGAELDMLEGVRGLAAGGALRFVVVSTHHHSISQSATTHRDCEALLRELGAHIICEHSVPESHSGDGLVVASLDPRDSFTVPISFNRARDSFFGELEPDLEAALASGGTRG